MVTPLVNPPNYLTEPSAAQALNAAAGTGSAAGVQQVTNPDGSTQYQYVDAQGRPIQQPQIERTPMPIDASLGLGSNPTQSPTAPNTPVSQPTVPPPLVQPPTSTESAHNGGDHRSTGQTPQSNGTNPLPATQGQQPDHNSNFGSGLFGASDFLSAEPGRFSVAGFSTGTGFSNSGIMHDTANFDAGDFIGGILGGAVGIPGGGILGRQLDANAVLSGDATNVSAGQVVAEPDKYTSRQLTAAKEYLDRVGKDPLKGAMTSDLAENTEQGNDYKSGQIGRITGPDGKPMSPVSETARETPYGPTTQFGHVVGIPGRRPTAPVSGIPQTPATMPTPNPLNTSMTTAALGALSAARKQRTPEQRAETTAKANSMADHRNDNTGKGERGDYGRGYDASDSYGEGRAGNSNAGNHGGNERSGNGRADNDAGGPGGSHGIQGHV